MKSAKRKKRDEQVIRSTLTIKGVTKVVWYIRDTFLDYWRGVDALDGYAAWTRDPELRRRFDTRDKARQEIKSIVAYRAARAG